MSEYVTLMGAEQVSVAGHNMVRAAEEMRRAAGNIEEVLRHHQRFMEEWIGRLEAAMTSGDAPREGGAT